MKHNRAQDTNKIFIIVINHKCDFWIADCDVRSFDVRDKKPIVVPCYHQKASVPVERNKITGATI